MSEASKSNTWNSSKRRIHEIDATISRLSHEATKLNDDVFKSKFECSLMTAKLKREKVKALTAIGKSQVILADMDILIAESDLCTDLERLKNVKKFKSDHNEGKSCSLKSTLDQTTQTTFAHQKKKKKSSSTKKKSIIDPASDETTLVETTDINKTEFVIDSPQFNTQLPNKPKSTNTSDSEVSLSSSIKAEFNNPYTNRDTAECEKKTHKSDKKISTSKQNLTQSITTKTVEDINRSLFSAKLHNTKNTISSPKNTASIPKTPVSTAKSRVSTPKNNRQNIRLEPYQRDRIATPCTSTYVPMVIAPAKNLHVPLTTTAMVNPCVYVSTAVPQPSIYQPPNGGMNSQFYNFYGSKQ